jgi:hypothetical protein
VRTLSVEALERSNPKLREGGLERGSTRMKSGLRG